MQCKTVTLRGPESVALRGGKRIAAGGWRAAIHGFAVA